MTTKIPEHDWLLFGNRKAFDADFLNSPPEPISGPIEKRHNPNLLLSRYSNEWNWSEEIAAWGRDHSLFIEADEE